MKKLLPILLVVVGLVAGIGAGAFLAPEPEVAEFTEECPEGEQECNQEPNLPAPKPAKKVASVDEEWDYVKLPKQFVIPVIQRDKVRALVVLSLSLEVGVGETDGVLAKAPKLRDSFLQVLFDHANSGGFDGAFTTGRSMADLRSELTEVAASLLGDKVNSVLIDEIVKQAM